MLKATSVEEVLEELFVLFVIRSIFKFQLTTVCHVLSELFRVTMTKRFNGSVHFALLNLSVFVVLVSSTKSLPRKLTLKQIQDNIACAF